MSYSGLTAAEIGVKLDRATARIRKLQEAHAQALRREAPPRKRCPSCGSHYERASIHHHWCVWTDPNKE